MSIKDKTTGLKIALKVPEHLSNGDISRHVKGYFDWREFFTAFVIGIFELMFCVHVL
jgi:hypothetical protein